MKKTQQWSTKKLTLPALGFLGTLTSLLTIVSIGSSNQIVKTKNQLIKDFASNQNQIQRSITDNITNTDRIQNPDEVFYTNEDLANKDVWDTTTNTESAANKTLFKNFKTNLEATIGNSSVKEELLKINDEIEKYLKYKEVEKTYKSSSLNDTIPWENIKETFKQQLDNPKESFQEIEQLKEIDKSMAQLSGLTEDQPVSSIKQLVAQNLKSNNLTASTGNSSALNNVEQVAGTGFKNLIKIAEINLEQQQNFILDYTYQSTSASNAAKGHLIIRNDRGQVKDATNLKEAYDKLDIFGRYDPLPKSAAVGDGAHPKQQQNIVLKKNDNTLTILARLKTGQILRDISFSADGGQPEKFGILDVQANDKTTFRKIITSKNTTTEEKLMDSTNASQNSNDQLVSIQFFSSEFFSKRMDAQAAPFELSADKNRYIQVYQGIETASGNAGGNGQPDEEGNTNLLSLDLNYVTRFAQEGTTTDNDYEPIKEYVAGVATNKTISLDLTFDGTNPSKVNDQDNSTYNFFALLKESLDKEILKLFPQVSEITVRSSVDKANKIAKQEIGYSDLFYLIGNPSTKVGIDNSTELSNKIPDLTRKIFAEAPEQFQDPTPPY